MKRIDSQNQAFYYMLLVIGIAATAAVTGFTKTDQMAQIFFWLLLFLPIITAPLAFIFFDHEMAIHSVGSYIYWAWTKNTVDPLLRNKHTFKDSLSFAFLNTSSKKIHGELSDRRWNLFLIPTWWTTIGVIIYAGVYYEWWVNVLKNQSLYKSVFGFLFCAVIWWANLQSSLLIRRAIKWTRVKHNTKRHAIIYFKPEISEEERGIETLIEQVLSAPHSGDGSRLFSESVLDVEKFPKLGSQAVYVLTFQLDTSKEQRNEIIAKFKQTQMVKAVLENVIPAEVKDLPQSEPAMLSN
jgi:hypothetical protein